MSNLFTIRFFKFGIAGLTGIAIDFSLTWICKERLKINKYISNSLGLSFAVVSNFILNRY